MEPAIIIISAQARRGKAMQRRCCGDATLLTAATDGKWSHEIEHRRNDVGNDVSNANANGNGKGNGSCRANLQTFFQ